MVGAGRFFYIWKNHVSELDNKPDQPEGRLVIFMSMNEPATVVYSTAVWMVYSPAMLSDAWCLVTSPSL